MTAMLSEYSVGEAGSYIPTRAWLGKYGLLLCKREPSENESWDVITHYVN